MYPAVLMVHSVVRWLVLVMVLMRLTSAGWAWLRGNAWTAMDKRVSLVGMILADAQLTIGVVLYLVSPTIHDALANPGAAMGNAVQRRALVEHPTLMVLGVAALHVGNVLVKRTSSDAGKHRAAALAAGAALVLMVLGLPR